MATYKNDGEQTLIFPSLLDADGNVLVVEAGATFDAPDDLTAVGVSLVVGKASKSAPVEPVVEPEVSVDEAKVE
jgi:hypothetical protein